MESNKDESDRCINLAKKHIDTGDLDKAVKFLQKAERLFPSQRAKGLSFTVAVVVCCVRSSAVLIRLNSLNP
jgi:hypothetical protein